MLVVQHLVFLVFYNNIVSLTCMIDLGDISVQFVTILADMGE